MDNGNKGWGSGDGSETGPVMKGKFLFTNIGARGEQQQTGISAIKVLELLFIIMIL